MAIDLPAIISRFLTPEIIGRIASALGIDPNTAQTAINAAVPSLLAGFSKVAAQPGGAQKIADAATQHTGTLDNLAGMLGSGNQSSLVQQGSSMLSSLLGGSDQNTLVGAISKFTGLGQGTSGPLLGMLAPVVMGSIAKQQGATGRLDPSKISSLLASQKDNIASALPAGMGGLLSGTGLLDSLGGATRMATAATGDAGRAAAGAARAVTDTGRNVAATASNSNRWLYWLIPAAAAAALLIYVNRPTGPVVQQGTTAMQTASAAATDAGKQVTDSISGLRTTLAGINSPASAHAALPKLQQVAAQLDKVHDMAGQLPAEQRKLVSGLVTPAMPSLNQLFDKALAIPGVSDELKPVIESLKAKLTTLAA
jgi:hypothetical protein